MAGESERSGPIAIALKAIAVVVMIAIPVLGVWAASSLAAYWNGPIWAAIVAGLLLFPGLPLAWEGASAWRRARAKTKRPPILTFGDRMILRTLALNVAFVGGFVALWPEAIFTALSTRGDWFLESVDGTASARDLVLAGADRLAWLHALASENEYAREEEVEPDPVVDPRAGRLARNESVEDDGVVRGPVTVTGTQTIAGSGTIDHGTAPVAEEPDPDPQPAPSGPAPRRWPYDDKVHLAIQRMPPEAEASIASVGAYVSENVADPFERAKAVHDYVATRVAYDFPALTSPSRPPQDAETVFRTRRGVCAGYAQLFEAIATAAGLRAEYVVGDARSRGDDTDGESHAWNAVELEGAWYLVDVTWDAGHRGAGDAFVRAYRTDYFLTPPEAFGLDHFPERAAWQLRETPITRGEFNRQPNVSPRFVSEGLRMIAPDRSQVDVGTTFDATIESTRNRFLMAEIYPRGALEGGTPCTVEGARTARIHCDVPAPGRYDVWFFSGTSQYGRFQGVGSVQVVRR